MTETCCGKMWDGWRYHACTNRAKVEVAGKPYCGVHDPRRAQARREKQDVIYAAKSKVWSVEREIVDLRQELVEWALAHPEARGIAARWADAQGRLSDAKAKLSEISR